MTKHQKDILKALKESVLGREGLIVDVMFKPNILNEINDLIKDGIVVELRHFKTYHYLSNNTHYGLASEEYPETDEEWSRYRNTGASKIMTFREFKESLKNGEYDEEEEKKGFKKVDEYWNDNFKTKGLNHYLNYFKRHMSDCVVTVSENIRAGVSPEENIFNLFVKFNHDEIFEEVNSGEFSGEKEDKKFVLNWLLKVLEEKDK